MSVCNFSSHNIFHLRDTANALCSMLVYSCRLSKCQMMRMSLDFSTSLSVNFVFTYFLFCMCGSIYLFFCYFIFPYSQTLWVTGSTMSEPCLLFFNPVYIPVVWHLFFFSAVVDNSHLFNCFGCFTCTFVRSFIRFSNVVHFVALECLRRWCYYATWNSNAIWLT